MAVAWSEAVSLPRHPSLSPFLCRMVEYSLDLQNINLSAIRTVRVLRPLKAINRVPSELAPPVAPCLGSHSCTKTRLTSTFQRLGWAWGSLSDWTDVGPAPTRLLGPFLGGREVLVALSPIRTGVAGFWGVWFFGDKAPRVGRLSRRAHM